MPRDQPGVVAGAAGEDQHSFDAGEDFCGARAEELGPDAADAFQRVGDGARLLEDLLLHVVAVRAQLDRVADVLTVTTSRATRAPLPS